MKQQARVALVETCSARVLRYYWPKQFAYVQRLADRLDRRYGGLHIAVRTYDRWKDK